MTSPRRYRQSGAQGTIRHSDLDSPSMDTGTVSRRSSCPESSTKRAARMHDATFEAHTPSDSGSGTSRSLDDNDKADSLEDVEQRISSIINASRSSKSNSESSDIEVTINSLLENSIDGEFFRIAQNETFLCDPSKTFNKAQVSKSIRDKCNANSVDALSPDKKNCDRTLKTPAPINKLNKSLLIVKNNTKFTRDRPKIENKVSVPVYTSSIRGSLDLSANNQKKRGTSNLRLPFLPAKAMDKPKINFFQTKNVQDDSKTSPLLATPVRRTISNEYVRVKFGNETVVRRTVDGKSVRKITPKIQSIIPESPVDRDDPFLNLSPNKKYTVTVNNKVRCDKDNYVRFDPDTGFKPDDTKQSRVLSKSPIGEKSRIPLRSPPGENFGAVRKSVNVSDTDSGILSPNSPVETSERTPAHYVNAAVFSKAAKKCAADLGITVLDPGLAKKAAEQIKVSANVTA